MLLKWTSNISLFSKCNVGISTYQRTHYFCFVIPFHEIGSMRWSIWLCWKHHSVTLLFIFILIWMQFITYFCDSILYFIELIRFHYCFQNHPSYPHLLNTLISPALCKKTCNRNQPPKRILPDQVGRERTNQ